MNSDWRGEAMFYSVEGESRAESMVMASAKHGYVLRKNAGALRITTT